MNPRVIPFFCVEQLSTSRKIMTTKRKKLKKRQFLIGTGDTKNATYSLVLKVNVYRENLLIARQKGHYSNKQLELDTVDDLTPGKMAAISRAIKSVKRPIATPYL